MHVRMRYLLATILALGLFGTGAASTKASPDSTDPRTLDDRLAEVAKRAPSFGGMRVDEARDTLIIRLTDPADNAEVRKAVRAEFGRGELGGASKMRTARARYGMLELGEWSERMTDVLNVEGVVFTDLNEARNRLQVGLSAEGSEAEVEAKLDELEIPREAAIITEAEPIEPMLRQRHRPIVGGLQINFPGFFCTLGFSAQHLGAGSGGFVTNSHCSAVTSENTNTRYDQPLSSAPGSLIGRERRDPPLFTNAEDPACPAGRDCRYSDALWAIRRDGVFFTRFIARVGFNFNPATDQWNGTSKLRIARRGDIVATGVRINKIGRTTGRTRGDIANTCVNANVSGTNITRLCETTVVGSGTVIDSGDSGSAAIRVTGLPEPGDSRLVGIMWGGGGNTMVYSPWSDVRSELGRMQVCAAGFSC